MKKILIRMLCISICFILLLSLGACGSSEDKLKAKVIGEWSGDIIYEDNYVNYGWIDFEATCSLTIRKDGTFSLVITGGDDAESIDNLTGTWGIYMDEIRFYCGYDTGSTSLYGDSLFVTLDDYNEYADKNSPYYHSRRLKLKLNKVS